MSVDKQQIDSIIRELYKFGDDGVAFDAWMSSVAPFIRTHGDVGQFRQNARSLWLTNNKLGVASLVASILSGPSIAERAVAEEGDVAGTLGEAAYVRFLTRMGIHRGDTLSVHTTHGELVQLLFDDERLPERESPKTAPTPKKKRARRSTKKTPALDAKLEQTSSDDS